MILFYLQALNSFALSKNYSFLINIYLTIKAALHCVKLAMDLIIISVKAVKKIIIYMKIK